MPESIGWVLAAVITLVNIGTCVYLATRDVRQSAQFSKWFSTSNYASGYNDGADYHSRNARANETQEEGSYRENRGHDGDYLKRIVDAVDRDREQEQEQAEEAIATRIVDAEASGKPLMMDGEDDER